MNFTTFFKSANFGELRSRLTFLLLALLVFRVGTHIPLPGLNLTLLQAQTQGAQSGVLGMVNTLSGGALLHFSILALGILPYISASIMLQLMGYVIPALEVLKKDGEAGRRKLTQYTRYAAVGLAAVQGTGIAHMLQQTEGMVLHPGVFFYLSTVATLTAGAVFVMWLGEQVSDRGIGNGTSLIIFAGIAAGIPAGIGSLIELVRTGGMPVVVALMVAVLIAAVTYGAVYIEQGLRKIPITYARAQSKVRSYGVHTSHLPMKLNMAGVIPAVFASTLIAVPAMLARLFGDNENLHWLKTASDFMAPGSIWHMAIFGITVIFFCFFYTALAFNTNDIADNLKKSGAFIPGIRPGLPTAKFIDGIMSRLTAVGAVYVTIICLLPEWLTREFNIPFAFGGTSLLIIVVVAMDLRAQLKNYFVAYRYDNYFAKRLRD